ncbi:RNA polymerase sigma factor [Sphingosinicella terrae]|uniref:RNA polymerase sigma factor n=1 Tax=Sphingosinicella terrae TaxID=2172047 RepID=UPI000E0CD9F8|nr:RNA polymerase sigma factor [Sphingosinicella terrae]
MDNCDDERTDDPLKATAPADGPVDRLYRDRAARLRRRLQRRLQSSEEASDIVQDAFARLLGAAGQQHLRQPEAFLNRIVRNLLIDRARRSAHRPKHVEIDEANEPAVAPAQSDGIEVDQLRERYRAAVAALPPRMREVFLLHRVDSLGYGEIAERLAISVRTVEWHFAEAIVRIGRELDIP